MNHLADCRLLLQGIDTLECVYYLRPAGSPRDGSLDFAWLGVEKEALRQSGLRDPKPVTLGGVEFLLQPYGSSCGFPFILSNADYVIQLGEYNVPPFFVKFRSEALWREGPQALHDKFMSWAQRLGLIQFKAEGLSRVDWAFDYALSSIDFDEDHFVSLSSKDAQYRQDGRPQTFTFGRDDVVLRVYDKVAEILQQSEKVFFFQLWGSTESAWRIEWQVRKDKLREFGIVTFQDLRDRQAALLEYLATQHTTLRIPTQDGNRSRWPLHPLWADLHERICTMEGLGRGRPVDHPRMMAERMTRIAIAVQGYLKRVAAIYRLQHGEDFVSREEALAHLEHFLARVHDPLTWRTDVDKRFTAMRLGEW